MVDYSFKAEATQEIKDFYTAIKKDVVQISTHQDIEKLCLDIHVMSKEVCRVFLLNSQNQVIDSVDFMGSTNHCTVYTRDVFQHAFACDASAIAMAHNHPAGSSEVSNADWNLTERIGVVGKGLNIPLIDHVILWGQGTTSLRSMNRWCSDWS